MALEWFSSAAARILIDLLESERYVSWFYRSEHNPKGAGSSKTVIRTRDTLLKLNLIETYTGEERPRLYLKLTDKGRRVAEHLKAIEDLLQSA